MPYLKKPAKQRIRKVNYEDRQKVYQSAQWDKLREAKLMECPLCELCQVQGRITPATEIHHDSSFITQDGVDYGKAYDYSNLIALCKECHSKWHRRFGRTSGGMADYITSLKTDGEMQIEDKADDI